VNRLHRTRTPSRGQTELDDLVVELHPAGAVEHDIDLLSLAVAVAVGCRTSVIVTHGVTQRAGLVDQAVEEIAPTDGEAGTGSSGSDWPDRVRRVQGE
jgi:hypothetical protein